VENVKVRRYESEKVGKRNKGIEGPRDKGLEEK